MSRAKSIDSPCRSPVERTRSVATRAADRARGDDGRTGDEQEGAGEESMGEARGLYRRVPPGATAKTGPAFACGVPRSGYQGRLKVFTVVMHLMASMTPSLMPSPLSLMPPNGLHSMR